MRDKVKTLTAITFSVIAATLLLSHSELLYELQNSSIFIKGNTFMSTTVTSMNGLWTWIGCYLTQFFYIPWLGTTLLIAIWILTFYVTSDMFRLHGIYSAIAIIPVAAQLLSIYFMGYWIYYCKQPGFAFAQAVSIFVTVTIAHVATTAVMAFAKPKQNETVINASAGVITVILAALILRPVFKIYSLETPDKRIYHEMKMYKAMDECRWDDVIGEMKDVDEPTNLMVLYKNIALMHTGRMTEMFTTNNCGVVPQTPDSLNIHISQLGASMIYYQFGQINNAYRWAIENSVEYGMSVKELKMLIRCSILNQEFDVARKYITLLKATTFHRTWAEQQESHIRHSSNLIKSQEFQNIAPLLNEDVNLLDIDNGLCEKWLLEHFSDLAYPTTPKLEEVIMTLSLWYEDDYAFCLHFYNYVKRHQGQAIPHLFQEGAILLCTQESSPVELNDFPFDNIITERYNSFVRDYNELTKQGVNDEEKGKRMRALYGDTYWWYYYFYTDFKIY